MFKAIGFGAGVSGRLLCSQFGSNSSGPYYMPQNTGVVFPEPDSARMVLLRTVPRDLCLLNRCNDGWKDVSIGRDFVQALSAQGSPF